MKKNKSLSNFEMHNSSVSSKNAIHKRTKDAEAIYAETSEKIKRGLEKATASTGTPIASLKGGAKYMAQLSNVGGGSVKIGGGGIKEGFNTFDLRVQFFSLSGTCFFSDVFSCGTKCTAA